MDPRVTGAQRYSVEVERPGMLHAAFVRSPHPHARVVSVSAPDDVVVLTGDDVADLGLYGCQVKDQRVLANPARHAGDVVAAVAAPTRERARAAGHDRHVHQHHRRAADDQGRLRRPVRVQPGRRQQQRAGQHVVRRRRLAATRVD